MSSNDTTTANVYPKCPSDTIPETVEVSEEDVLRGVTYMECPACQGTGVFAGHPKYDQPCVECSTTGKRPVTV